MTYDGDVDKRPSELRTIKLRSVSPARAKGTVGVGVIGAGLFARTVLLPALRAVPGLRLRGIATVSGSSARSAGGRFGFEYCTTDPQALLSDDVVQAVVIATRHDLHPSLTVEALRAGKHVFVEKPLALTVDGVRRIVQAYSHFPRVVMVGYNRRFSPLVKEVKAFLGSVRPLAIDHL